MNFSVEEDEPDEIITTNTHHLNRNDEEEEDNDDTKGLYQSGPDIPLSTIQPKTKLPKKKRSKTLV